MFMLKATMWFSCCVCIFQCLLEMLNHAPFLYTTELESLATLCFRAFDGSNYEVRCAVAKLLGTLIATTQQTQKGNPAGNKQFNQPTNLCSGANEMLLLSFSLPQKPQYSWTFHPYCLDFLTYTVEFSLHWLNNYFGLFANTELSMYNTSIYLLDMGDENPV
jgi:hypothetical protein